MTTLRRLQAAAIVSTSSSAARLPSLSVPINRLTFSLPVTTSGSRPTSSYRPVSSTSDTAVPLPAGQPPLLWQKPQTTSRPPRQAVSRSSPRQRLPPAAVPPATCRLPPRMRGAANPANRVLFADDEDHVRQAGIVLAGLPCRRPCEPCPPPARLSYRATTTTGRGHLLDIYIYPCAN